MRCHCYLTWPRSALRRKTKFERLTGIGPYSYYRAHRAKRSTVLFRALVHRTQQIRHPVGITRASVTQAWGSQVPLQVIKRGGKPVRHWTVLHRCTRVEQHQFHLGTLLRDEPTNVTDVISATRYRLRKSDWSDMAPPQCTCWYGGPASS